MKYLLDTCGFLRFVSKTEGPLGQLAKDVLTEENSEVYYSPLIAVEMELARRKKRRIFSGPAISIIQNIAKDGHWQSLLFDDSCAEKLPFLMEAGVWDPFDLMIAATSLAHDAVLLTCDEKLTKITGLKTMW